MIRIWVLLLSFTVSSFAQLVTATNALQDYPVIFGWAATTSNCTLNEAADRCGFVIQATRAGAISAVRLRMSSATTAQSVTVDVQTVSTSTGDPSGSLWATGTTGTIAVPAASTWHEVSLTQPATVAIGDVFAVVAYFTSTVGDVALRLGITTSNGLVNYYTDQKDGAGAWSKGANNMALQYQIGGVWYSASETHMGGFLSSITYNSTSTPNEYGNRIESAYTLRVVGVRAYSNAIGAGSSLVGKVYTPSGTYSTVSVDGDQVRANGWFYLPFTSPFIVYRGDSLTVTLAPQNSTNISLTGSDVGSTAAAAGWPYGTTIYGESKGTGATTYPTIRYTVGLVYDAMSAGGSPGVMIQ